jgi:hypothetical protein
MIAAGPGELQENGAAIGPGFCRRFWDREAV